MRFVVLEILGDFGSQKVFTYIRDDNNNKIP